VVSAAAVVGVAVVATGAWQGVAREICSDVTGRRRTDASRLRSPERRRLARRITLRRERSGARAQVTANRRDSSWAPKPPMACGQLRVLEAAPGFLFSQRGCSRRQL
jgi:hypothetical protein